MLDFMLRAKAERRRQESALRFDGCRPDIVAEVAIGQASVFLNPRNGPAGCSAWRLCRRLGCERDVFPVLRASNVFRVEDLR